MSNPRLLEFVRESNRIEGIVREPTDGEVEAHIEFLALDVVRVGDLKRFVRAVAGERLRDKRGMDVRVGAHYPPPGGAAVDRELRIILGAASDEPAVTPFEVHVAYEKLHPFMDGNGRSGRALWAWMMISDGQDPFSLPFLHRFYYQALDGGRGGAGP